MIKKSNPGSGYWLGAACALLAGVLISCLLFASICATSERFLKVYVRNTVYLQNFRDYYLFDPASADKRKYAFISSSFYAQNDTMNESSGHNRAHPGGYIGQLANHLLATEYDSDLQFYDFGRSKTNSFDHLWFFYQFLQAPGAEGVLYTAGIENITGLKPDSDMDRNYVTLAVLEALAKRYPGLRAQVEVLEDHLLGQLGISPAQKRSLLEQKIDPDTLLIRVDNKTRHLQLAFVTDDHRDGRTLLTSLPRLRDVIVRWLVYTLTGREENWSDSIRQQYSDALPEYGRPIHDRPNLVRTASVDIAQGRDRLEAAFYELLIGIADIEGIKIVFYHPPTYLLTPYQYWQVLRPEFFDRFQSSYAGLDNVHFIDHVFLPGINHYDFTYTRREECEGLCKDGYRLGIIGNVKRARALLGEFENLGLLNAADASRSLTSFAEESTLPDIPMCLKIIGLEQSGCIYETADYRAGSRKAQLPLREIVDIGNSDNPYIRRTFFDVDTR